MTLTIIAMRPQFNFNEARDSKRESDIQIILNAVIRYTSEGSHSIADFGVVPTCPTTKDIGSGVGNINLTAILVPTYFGELPKDPSTGTITNSHYAICQSANGQVTISAPDAQNKIVSVTR